MFPIGTKKQTYQVFDTTLNKPVPFPFAGTATVRGIETYKFTEDVAPVQVATQTVPGSLVGMSAASVTLPEFYEIHLIYYVDPATGALINVQEHQTMTLRNPSTGAQALLLFDANLKVTPATADRDREAGHQRPERAHPAQGRLAPGPRHRRRHRPGRRAHPRPQAASGVDDELTEMSREYAPATARSRRSEKPDRTG